MATKNIKSVGSYPSKSYFDNAAKQFRWPINHDDKTILVPEIELDEANDDLMVSHFRSHGWHIQSCIEVEYTKPFIAPENKGPIFKEFKKPEVKQTSSLYSIGDEFQIKSTGCELIIEHMEKGKVHLKYTNRNKPNLLSSEENLTSVLRKELWIKIQ